MGTGASVAQVPKPRPASVVEVPERGCRLATEPPHRALSGDGAGDRIRTGDPLLGKHCPLCAVLQTWEQSEMLSSYLLLRAAAAESRKPRCSTPTMTACRMPTSPDEAVAVSC